MCSTLQIFSEECSQELIVSSLLFFVLDHWVKKSLVASITQLKHCLPRHCLRVSGVY